MIKSYIYPFFINFNSLILFHYQYTICLLINIIVFWINEYKGMERNIYWHPEDETKYKPK